MTYDEFMQGNPQSETGSIRLDLLKQIADEHSQRIRQESIDRSNAYLSPEQKLQPYGVSTSTITPDRQLSLAKDFYSNKTQVAGPYSPAFSFVKAQGTVLPSDTPVDARQKTVTDINPTQVVDQYRPNTNTSQSTPVIDPNAQGPLAATFGALRATSDIASLSLGVPMAALDKQTDVKTIFKETIDNARKDAQSGGTYSIDNAAQSYLQKSGLKDSSGNVLRNPNLTELAVLTSLWFQDIAGDPLLMIPGLKSVKEFALWKKVVSVEKQLPEFIKIGTKDVGSVGAKNIPIRQFNAGETKEVGIGNNVKIKIIPKENSVVYKGYIRRGTNGNVLNPETEITGVAEEVSTATGKTITPKVVGNDLVLTAEKTPTISSGLKTILKERQVRVAAVKGTSDVINKSTVGFDGYDYSNGKTTPVVKEEKVTPKTVTSKTTINPEQTFYHGTTAKFDNFDIQKAGENTGWDNAKFGIFFSDDKTVARKFVTDNTPGVKSEWVNIKEVKLNIKKPLDLTLRGIFTNKGQAPLIVLMLKGEKLPPAKALALLNDTIDMGDISDLYDGIYGDIKNKTLIQRAGYDGIVSDFGGDKLEYAVLDHKQITVIKKETPIAKGLQDIVTARQERVIAVSEPVGGAVGKTTTKKTPIKKIKKEKVVNPAVARLAEERAALADKFKGGEARVSDITPVKGSAPVEPDYKTASSYEIGEYYKAKELWDKSQSFERGEKIIKGKDVSGIKHQPIQIQLKESMSDGKSLRFFEQLSDQKAMEGRFDDVEEIENFIHEHFNGDDLIEEYDDLLEETRSKAGIDNTVPDNFDRELNLKVKKLHQMNYDLMKKFGMTVTEKNLPRGVEGLNYKEDSLTAVRSLNNLPVIAHETAHFLDNKFKISESIKAGEGVDILKIAGELKSLYRKVYKGKGKDAKKMIREGLATYIQKYIEDPVYATTEYPELTTFLLTEDSPGFVPELKEFVGEARNIVNYYGGLSTIEKEISKGGETITEVKRLKLMSLADRAIEAGANFIHPMEVLAQKMGLHRTIKDPSIWMYAKTDYANNVFLNNIIGNDGYWSINPQGELVKKFNYTTDDIKHEINKFSTTDEFDAYKIAERRFYKFMKLKELIKEKSLQTDSKKYIKLLKHIGDIKSQLSNEKSDIARDSEIYLQNKKKFSEVEKKYNAINSESLNSVHEYNLITDEYKAELDATKGYAPFIRLVVNETISSEQSIGLYKRGGTPFGYKKYKGSDKPILSPLIGQDRLVYETSKMTMLQKVAQTLFENRTLSNGEVKLISTKKTGKGIFFPKVNGKTIEFFDAKNHVIHKMLIGDDIARVFDVDARTNHISGFEKLLRIPSQLFVTGTTGFLRPAFAVSNTTLDAVSAFAQTQNKTHPLIAGVAHLTQALYEKGLGKTTEDTRIYDNYLRLGGAQNNRLGSYSKGAQEIYEDNISINKDINQFAELLSKGYDKTIKAISSPGYFSELVERYGEFYQSLRNGKPEIIAFDDAVRVTAAFRRHPGGLEFLGTRTGVITRGMIQGIPYFKAILQVRAAQFQSIKEPRTRGRALATILLVSALKFLSMAAIIKKITDSDATDDEKEVMSAEIRNRTVYDTGNYLQMTLGNTTHNIRIPGEYGIPGTVMSMMLAEKMLDINYTKKDFYDVTVGTILPQQLDVVNFKTFLTSWVGMPIKPVFEASLNYKSFPEYGEIESDWQKKIPSEQRKTAYTSDFAIMLGETDTAKKLNISPLKIDAILKGYAGSGPTTSLRNTDQGFQGVLDGFAQTFRFGNKPSPFLGKEFNNAYAVRDKLSIEKQRYNTGTPEYNKFNTEWKRVDLVLSVVSSAKDAYVAQTLTPEMQSVVTRLIHYISNGESDKAKELYNENVVNIQVMNNESKIRKANAKREMKQ